MDLVPKPRSAEIKSALFYETLHHRQSYSVLEMRTLLTTTLFFLYVNFAQAESAIFDYDDFGPQVLAYKTIGYQWYQWNRSGSSDPKDKDSIKVVVYWNIPIAIIQEKYPIDPQSKSDYRYLSYDTAIEYLDYAIAEIPYKKHLISTRNRLLQLRNR